MNPFNLPKTSFALVAACSTLALSIAAQSTVLENSQIGTGASEPDTQLGPEYVPDLAESGALPGYDEFAAFEIYAEKCSVCHDSPTWFQLSLFAKEKPHAFAVDALTIGTMRAIGQEMSAEEISLAASYITGRPEEPRRERDLSVSESCDALPSRGAVMGSFANWGGGLRNLREYTSRGKASTVAARYEPSLSWAVAIPEASNVRSQPTFAQGSVYFGAHTGAVYALDQASGCTHWIFRADAEVRSAVTIEEAETGTASQQRTAFFGDVAANVYAINASTGAEIWRRSADSNPHARITGSIVAYDGKLYVPISTSEDQRATDPAYPCCQHRGSLLALDAETGEALWRYYPVESESVLQGKREDGTEQFGPSGGSIWTAPTIDVARGAVYIGTGNNHSIPATEGSDSVIALELKTGRKLWEFQATTGDAWNASCSLRAISNANCPTDAGPNHDFGSAPILVETESGDILVAAQKSGWVFGLQPETGDLLWKTRIALGGQVGGTHFGGAASEGLVYFPVMDLVGSGYSSEPTEGEAGFKPSPGVFALDARTGTVAWSRVGQSICAGQQACSAHVSAPPSVSGDTLTVGFTDGMVRGFEKATGDTLWEIKTASKHPALLDRVAQGGGIGGAAGPVVIDGRLFTSSGLGFYGEGLVGNAFLSLDLSAADEAEPNGAN